MKQIWLAGGCFWGVEAYFQQLTGVLKTRVGYGQGFTDHPTYKEVSSGATGYTEVCEVTYDEAIVPFGKILEHFFRIIDPTTLNRQGPDQGTQYRTGIYYKMPEEQQVICDFITEMQAQYDAEIVVEVAPVISFYVAEAYHQSYLKNTPGGYCHVNLNLARPEERR